MNKPNKLNIFADYRNQMHSSTQVAAFDILSPYYPGIPEDAPNGQYLFAIDSTDGYKEGGSALLNCNMEPNEAQVAADTIEEIGCGCLFIVPFPTSGLFTEQYIGVGIGSDGKAWKVHAANNNALVNKHVSFPPYFAVHMTNAGNKPHCRDKFSNLFLLNMHAHMPGNETFREYNEAGSDYLRGLAKRR